MECKNCDGDGEVERDDGEVVPCACQYDYELCSSCLGVPMVRVIRGDVEEKLRCFECSGTGREHRRAA